MKHAATQLPTAQLPPLAGLAPIVAAIFVGFLVVGLPLPVIPLHVSRTLGYGPFVVGVIVGAQFLAALASRPWAGRMSDRHGGKRAVATGFAFSACAGLLYLASLLFLAHPAASLAVLIVARMSQGCGESFVATGSLAWAVARIGVRKTGVAMVWVGNAIFAAWAIGAPLGGWTYGAHGFAGVGVVAAVMPLLAIAVLARAASMHVAHDRAHLPFLAVLRSIAMPGTGMALASVGFGALSAFISLLYAARGFEHPAFAFTLFGVGFVVSRLLFGHLPDRIGGARVARWSVAAAAAGQALIAVAPNAWVALLGATLTGGGYSMAFPAYGVEAIKRAPAQARGAAMGAYVMFLDVALGLTGPLAGLLAGVAGYGAVYGAAALVTLGSLVVASRLLGKEGRS